MKRCPLCGKRIWAVFKTPENCPQCGARISEVLTESQSRETSAIPFPPRRNASLWESLKVSRQADVEKGIHDESDRLGASWDYIFSQRPLDVPWYTAVHGRPCILIYFSQSSMPHPEIMANVLKDRRDFLWQVRFHAYAGFPILRCNFLFPDDPDDPLVLESALDLADGDVQEFIESVIREPSVDVFFHHETLDESGILGIECAAPDMKMRLENAASSAAHGYPHSATVGSFVEAQHWMRLEFPAPGSGVDLGRCVRLIPQGWSKIEWVEY